MTRNKIFTAMLCAASCLVISACAATTGKHATGSGTDYNASTGYKGSSLSKGSQQSLTALEQAYKRNSEKPQAALDYAHALRQQGYYNRASMILRPFANDPSIEDASIATEFAAIQAAMGNYLDAEEAARKAVLLDPQSGKAYHLLGIALDAQGHHPQAHVAFEKGLELWEGDPSPILNNIGLNLAAQGFLDQAIETLRKALDTAPNRTEIERNLRIVSALQYQPPREGTRFVPRPARKPDTSASATRSTKTIASHTDSETSHSGSSVDAVEIENIEPAAATAPEPLKPAKTQLIINRESTSEGAAESIDRAQETAEIDSEYTPASKTSQSHSFNE